MGFNELIKNASEKIEKNTKELQKSFNDLDKRIDVKNISNKRINKLDNKDNLDSRITIKKQDMIGNNLKGETKTNDNSEKNKKLGGKYSDLQKSEKYDSKKYEIHHIPADSTSELSKNDGPAIIMDKLDHRKTASCGNSNEAKEYRNKQRELIKNGKIDKAIEMDIKDLKEKFGNKYDKQIDEMKEYIKQLKKDGKI